MYDRIAEVSLLYDFYGQLLSKRQKAVMELYYEENLSLSEIGEEFAITRQGVHDALKNAEKALNEYETKLGLVAKFEKSQRAFSNIENELAKLIEENGENRQLTAKLRDIKGIIEKLEE